MKQKRLLAALLLLSFLFVLPGLAEVKSASAATAKPILIPGATTAPKATAAPAATDETADETTDETADEATEAPDAAKESPKPAATEVEYQVKKKAPLSLYVINQDGASAYAKPSSSESAAAELKAGDKVLVRTLGLAFTAIKMDTKTLYVQTSDLGLVENGEALKLAVIAAPSGKLTLRAKDSAKGKAMGAVKTGRVGVVLKSGDEYTMINVNGIQAYAANKFLIEKEPASSGAALSALSNPKGKAIVQLTQRIEGSAKAFAIQKFKTNKEVILLSSQGDWAEVEYNGYYGYIQSKYLKQ